METWEVVGVDTKGKMTIKAENRTYEGVYLYLLGDAPDNTGRYRGRVVREQFISNERLEGFSDSVTEFFDGIQVFIDVLPPRVSGCVGVALGLFIAFIIIELLRDFL